MIRVEKLSYRYPDGETALDGLNLEINDGDFVGVTGASGAGKTTFALALNGVVPHRTGGDFYGAVTVNGMDTVDTAPERLAMTVGSVFQDIEGQLTASMVEDELLFGLENFGVSKQDIEGRVAGALDALGISTLRCRSISGLSGGQKQKVAIAAILALEPSIMVLDEPTGELDPQSSRQIFELLKELNKKRGMTVVIIEQKMQLLCEFTEKLLILQKGKSLYYGATRGALALDGLEEAGVGCPALASLSRELSRRGLYYGPAPVSIREAAEMVRGAVNG